MSEQRWFVERLGTPVGDLLLVTDEHARVRALDWTDCEARMHALLDVHYGRSRVRLVRRPAPFVGTRGRRRLPRRRPHVPRRRAGRHGGNAVPAGCMAGTAGDSARSDTQLRRARGVARSPHRRACRRASERRQPDRDRGPVSPGRRRRWLADGLRGRPGAQAVAAGPRGALRRGRGHGLRVKGGRQGNASPWRRAAVYSSPFLPFEAWAWSRHSPGRNRE